MIVTVMLSMAVSSFSSSRTLTGEAMADSINPGIYSKDSSPFGTPYSKWLANWWQWTFSIPAPQHPRDNYTPEKCAANQEGPVWFLADQLGGKEERTCTIPAGAAIMIPLLTGECDTGNSEDKSDEGLRSCAMAGDEYGVVEASVDGKKIKNLEQYRSQSGYFDINVVDGNIYEQPAGTYRAFADGFFVFLEPLTPGNHTANLKVSVLNPVEPSYNYNADWTYRLDVK
jgi:hypothetical protein